VLEAAEGGVFFREYWAEREGQANDSAGRFLRVNDAETALHPSFGRRAEARTNGLLLIEADEDLFGLGGAELYLELWGGHPGTARKRFFLNGRGPYELPEVGTEAGACTYSYPSVPLAVSHLVRGANAFQFACERGEGFWGHYIVDNACLRVVLKGGHPDVEAAGLAGFEAAVKAAEEVGDETAVWLECAAGCEDAVESVDYYARYGGFDDDGDGEEADWHGFTLARRPANHVGSAQAAPFALTWDTRMVPSQQADMALRAVVRLRGGLQYLTPVQRGLRFPADRPEVVLFRPAEMPTAFWSRASQAMEAVVELPADLSGVERAELWVKVWDGGAGEVAEPFTINGHAYGILSGTACHDVVFTRAEVPVRHLAGGANRLRLLSDTEHHGVEVLLPGPCLVLRTARGGAAGSVH
jgi:hypothetical protein